MHCTSPWCPAAAAAPRTLPAAQHRASAPAPRHPHACRPKASLHRNYAKTSQPPRRPYEKERLDQEMKVSVPEGTVDLGGGRGGQLALAGRHALVAREGGAVLRVDGEPWLPASNGCGGAP